MYKHTRMYTLSFFICCSFPPPREKRRPLPVLHAEGGQDPQANTRTQTGIDRLPPSTESSAD